MEKDGLVVIGVTDEPIELVSEWVEQRKATFPVVVAGEGNALEAFLERAVGKKAFPTVAVIHPDGKLLFAAHHGYEEALELALESAEKGPIFAKELRGVEKAMKAQDYPKAYAELLELQDGGRLSEEVGAQVAEIRTYLEGDSQRRLDAARQAVEEGLVYRALEHVEGIVGADPPFPASAPAGELVRELEALPSFKLELKGGELHADAVAAEKEYEYVDAFGLYAKVLKKYPETRIAEAARKAATRILDEGKAGYERACGDCRRERRACQKHHEQLEL